MPHPRNRYVLDVIKKKLKFSPVVAIQGARQTGKSFFVKNLLTKHCPNLHYLTFDKSGEREFADSNPDSFLEQYGDAKPLAIDEAQKVPKIFDAVKVSVDENRKPGRYLLLGSTEFSRLHKIRESLTGRISRARLFPLTVTESLARELSKSKAPFFLSEEPAVSRPEFLRFLSKGGLPGIFSVHSNSERTALLSDWLDLTTDRDIHQFPGVKLDSLLCQRILKGVAILDHPDLTSLAKYCGRDSRIVQRHIEALLTLFVLTKLPPHPNGSGKPIYLICDVALASFLGANFKRQLYTWALHEILSKQSYRGEYKRQFFYYKSFKGSVIEIVQEEGEMVSALKLHDRDKVTSKDLYGLIAFETKFPSTKLYLLGSTRQKWKDYRVEIYPWESLA